MIDADQINIHDPEIETVISSLINYLNQDSRMAEDIDKFYEEWPDAHEDEYEKTLSAHTVSSNHTHCQRRLEETTPINNDAINVASTYKVGMYEMQIQVDIWAPYKAQRNQLYQKFFKVINEEFLTQDQKPTGLSLTLENYFGTIARYDIVGYNFPDTERGSQEDDWRAVIDLQVHFDKRLQKKEAMILEPTLVTKDTDTDEEYISETVVIIE